MRVKFDIPAPINRLTCNSKHETSEFIICLVDIAESPRAVVLSDCVASCGMDDLPGAPQLVGSDSNPGDLPPANPPTRRAVSDWTELAHQEPVVGAVTDVQFSEAVFREGGGYIFSSNIPSGFFTGKYYLSGIISFPGETKKFQFEFQLPVGVREGISHIAYGNLRKTCSRSAALSSFHVLLSCQEYLLSRPGVRCQSLIDKAWIVRSLLSNMRALPCCFEDNKQEIGAGLLEELASAIECNKFRHPSIALLAVGQLRDLFDLQRVNGALGDLDDVPLSSSAPRRSTASLRVLYSLPLTLLRDGYVDSLDNHKLLSPASATLVGTDSFATSLWLRRGLTLLLDRDAACAIPNFRSCRAVIPLLRSLRSPATNSSILYACRADWGSLGQLERFRSLLVSLRAESAPFLRSSLNLPAEEIRAILSDSRREEESRIIASLLTSLSDIEAAHRGVLGGWGSCSDIDAVQIVRVKKMIDLCPEMCQRAVDAFDVWIANREALQGAADRYLSNLHRTHVEDSCVNPSFRRLWGFLDYLRCKQIINGVDISSDTNIESKGWWDGGCCDPSATSAVFVEVFAGIGKKGSCTPFLPRHATAQGITFNQPQDLAVCSDGFGNPVYSAGLDGNGDVYVADTLNHAVRVLVKPNEAYTLVGTGSPGCFFGEAKQTQFQLPRSLCTVTVEDVKGLANILVVADTYNHCVKGILLSRQGCAAPSGLRLMKTGPLLQDEVFLIAGGCKGGCDGPGDRAELNFPTGICHFDGALYVCCRGDHTLKRITTAASGWIVETVAGQAKSPGIEDGPNASLNSPTCCAAGPDGLYFVDQGRIQSVRFIPRGYREVTTLLTGEPLKNITSICYGRSGELLVCDRGSHCIWSLDTKTGIASVVVADVHLPPTGGHDVPLPFNPSAITKVGEGSYIFCDISRHQVFRMMISDCLLEAYQVADRVYGAEGVHSRALEDAIETYISGGMCAERAIKDAFRLSWRIKEAMMNRNYVRELEYMQPLVRQKLVPPDGTVMMLRNAPSLHAVHQFFLLMPMNSDTVMRYQEASASFIQTFDFSFDFLDRDAELQALVRLFHDAPSSIVTQDFLCRVLKDDRLLSILVVFVFNACIDRFLCPVSEHTLAMIGAILRHLNWTMDRSHVADLRRETVRWLGRVVHLDLPVTAHPVEAMTAVLLWWKEYLSTNQSFVDSMHVSKDDCVYRALEWIVRIHFDSFCFGFFTVVKEVTDIMDDAIKLDKSLLAIENACNLSTLVDSSPLVLTILGDTIADVSRTMNPMAACSALFSSLEARLGNGGHINSTALSEIVQHTLSDIMSGNFSIIEQRIDKRIQQQYEKARKYSTPEELSEIENKRLCPPIWEYYSEVISFEPGLWSNLLRWTKAESFELSREKTKWSKTLESLYNRIEQTFVEVNENALNGHLTVDMVRKIHGNKEELGPGWHILGCALGTLHLIEDLETEMQNALMEVKTISKVLTELMPDSLMLMDVQAALNNWSSLHLNVFRTMLRLPLPDSHLQYSSSFVEFHGLDFKDRMRSYPPFPPVVLEALDWLLLCTDKVDFFTSFWFANCDGTLTDENLVKVCSAWRELFASIVGRTISYSELDDNIAHFSAINEITVLAQTCFSGVGGNDVMQWSYLSQDNPEVVGCVKEILEVLKQWQKVQALFMSQRHLAEVIDLGVYVMNAAGELDMMRWRESLNNLIAAVLAKGDWGCQTLGQLDAYWPLAKDMDTAIFNVSTKLLASLQSNEPLTTFFRIVRDDNAFTSSLEVAMGLQEMECPAELWDSDRGRVDEKYLSMTRNIRSYLYHYLYNFPAKLSSVADFLTVFAHLNPSMSPDVIAENLNDCNRVREALMEIIRFDAEGASSSRLMKLYEPKCRSRWTLQCAGATSTYDLEGSVKSGMGFSDGGDSMLSGHHELLLEYCTRSHATGDERDLKHALPELLDFQSNIVLSREGDVVGGSLHTIVDTFLHQLGWTRRLRDVISQLSDAGHFDFYPSYLIHLSVELEDSEFVCRVEEAQRTLSQWTACIADLRDKFHFLNYFDIKRCFVLLDSLVKYVNNGRTGGSAFAALRDVVSGYVCFINPEAGHDEAITTEATDRLLRGWLASGQATLQTAASSALLVPFCGALHEALCFVGPRWRAVHLADMDQYVNVPELKNGIVYSVCAPSTKEEYEQALTMYASRGVMPEWEVCMVCSKYTSLETVSNFLLRWRKSHLFGRENSLFYMVEIQDLSYEIQDDIGHLLREILSEKSNSSVGGRMFSRGPLVLSSRGSKHVCPLTAQFQHSLISNSSLPSNILSKLFSQLADTRQGNVGVEVHHGKQVGCGKSFNIRLKAVNDRYTYAYVPVNGSAYLPRERSVLLKRIVDCLQSSKSIADEKPLLHVDVANSVNPTLASFLFELCSLGVISDHFGECMVCLPPGSTVCVELAASLLHSTLAHCMVYPVKIATSSRANFHLCNATLRAGMGPDFDSPIFDGTIGTGRGTGMSSATSFERLKYVCVALNVLHYGRGTFPYAFDVMDVSGISKGQLQRLLDMKASVDAVEDSNKLILSQAKTLEDREKRGEAHERIAAAHDIERLLFTGHGLDGARAFDLLFSAIKHGNIRENDIVPTQGNTHVSLWCIWNFVNVLYWQLKEMHVLDSPLNGACMPDAHTGARTLEEDTRSKRKIKGEILQFVIRTAGEFATRQTEMKPVADRITGVRVSGMGRAVFNKHWNRMAYDNDGKPCFRSPCSTYFLYYRALANSWVIDDIIETSGATYAFSKNDDINSLWIASPEWSKTTAVTSAPGPHMTSAYRSETILITGCSRIGGNCSSTEDGVYLRQPPYDDINGHPHFIKMSDKLGEGVRRHFFYSRFRRWIIAPQCNEDDGYFIMSENGQYSNTWLFLPPDAPERKAQFQIIRQRGEDDVSDSKLPGIALANDSNMADDLEEFPLFDLELLRWQDSNHECILFNNDAHTVAFLCANPTLMSKSLHPTLLRHLEQNGIRIEGGSMAGDEVSLSYWTILSALTGIAKGKEEASQLLGGSYCLTGDSLLKILAIVYRVRCGIPVVLLGECGCGKTALLSFLCAWLGVKLIALDVHGGTTEADILSVFEKAGEILTSNPTMATVYLFLDEINTCAHMGLITEAICRRSLNGRRIHEGIQVLAALNPYRVRPPRPEEHVDGDVGLKYHRAAVADNLTFDELTEHAMKNLVYKVHPIPPTLRDFIFDFGALDLDTEALYIQSMVAKQMSKCSNSDERNIISDLISRSQEYVRGFEGDPSVVSLRDVQRCIDLIRWFFLKVGVGKKGENKRSGRVVVSALGRSTILSIAIVYGYRLPSASSRNSFFLQISSIVKRWGKTATKVSFDELGRAGFAQTILDNMMRRFVNNLVVEESIALNQALTENLFVSIICILNKIPIFIVGKPGTSKTLAIQIIASNLQGKQSPMPLWRNFPAVYIFQYQCSPLSTSSSILYQFEAAKSYQEHAEDVLTVLLLDEVGLAENSPDMPLKVLHYMLVNPPVAIVGLSNWALDSSKMNRAVCLQRPEPSPEDIMFTGQNIVGSISEGASLESSSDLPPKPVLAREKSGATRLQPWLMNLAHAFHKIYSNQKQYFGAHSRDFIGMRDYYSLLKHLRQEFTARGSTSVTTAVLVNAVARNFGGKPHAIDAIVCLFCSLCFDTSAACCPATPSALPLIRENMVSTSSRHLMVLSTNDTALHLLFGSRVLNPKETTVLVGSRFKDDLQELHIVQQINQVKNAMARGHVVALMHNERYFDLYVSFLSYALFFSMFESLYDVLNQRYVRKTDIETGQEKLMLRLALGPRSQLCPVEKGFKLIVIVDQQQAYDSLDLPLLNRFEKQVLFPSDLLRSEMCGQALEKVQILCDKILLESGFSSLNEVFCGYYDKTVPSLVLNVTDFGRKRIYASDETLLGDSDGILLDDVIDRCVNTLVRVSFPTAMMRSSILRSFAACGDKGRSNKQYSFTQRHIFSALDEELNTDYSSSNKMLVVLTKSPISHFQLALESWRVACESTAIAEKYYIRSSHLKVIQLALISSERQLRADLNSFLSSYAADAPTSLVVLCDPLHCSPSLVSHARFVCTGAMQGHISRSGEESVRRHIVFVMHLPPGVRSRRREYILDFHPPWQYAFVDDVRADGDREGFSIGELVQKSSFDIYSKAPDALRHAMLDNFQSALSRCSSPFRNMLALNQAQRSYFKVTKDLLDDNLFLSFVQESVLLCLRHIGDGDSGDIPLHVTIACADYENIAGTFQECLIMALENLVIQALSHAIRNIDHDFNMGCIYSLMVNGGDESARTRYMQSWIALARKLCSPDAIARTSLVVSPASVDYKSDCVVRNSGLHGPLSCRFPFSEKIVAIIGHDHTRHQVETAVAGSISDNRAIGNNSAVLNTIRSTASFIGSVLGGETAGTPLGVFAAADAEAYLHDFVDIVIHPLPGLTHDFYCRLFKLIIQSDIADSINSSAWYLPSVVHATYWVHESDFFHIGSILSAVQSSVDVSFPSATYNDCRLGENLLTQLEMELQTGVAFSLEILTCQYICEFFLEGIFACIESDIVAKGHGRLPSTDVKKSTALLRLFRKILPHLRVLVTTCLQHMSGTLLVSTELLPQHLNVLKPFWRLLSSSIVLREMLRMVASEDTTWHSMSCARLSSSIVDNNSFHYSPISSESLQDILHRSDASGLPYCSLLRCYIMEFVRNECDFLNSVVGISITYPVDIITLVGKMLSPSVDYRYSADIHGFLLLRKEVVSFLVYVSSSKYEAGARQAASVVMGAMSADSNFATEAIVFYLGHLEDAYSSGALALCCDISLFCGFMSSTEESGALQLFQSSATGIVTQAVFARDRIRSLSASVAAYISHTTLRDCQFPLCSDQNVVSLMEVCEWAKIYFVKSLRDIGGNELVMEYLKRPRNHPALPCGTTLIDANKCKSLGTSVVDPFGLLHGKEAYALACNAYQATALRTSSHDTLDFFMQSMQQDSDVSRRCCLGLLVAATFAGHSRGDNTTTLQNWLSAEFPSGHAQGCRYGSYDSHGVAKRSIAWIQQLEDRDTKSKMELAFDQLVVHSAILAIRNPSSWMEMVVMNPSHLARAYVPGMPSSNLMGLVRAMGHVGWYKCKNGHPYTVGNCTFPMEESTCSAPGCNARIGGTNHTAVKGTTRLGSGDSAILCDPGYFSEDMMDELSYNGDISVMVVRLMLHSLMYLSSFDSRVERDLYAIVKSSNRTSATSTRDIIRQRMEFDFRTLKSVTMLPEVDLVMALHLTFQKWGDAVNGAAFRYSLSTPSDRDTFLSNFESQGVNPVFHDRLWRENIQRAKEACVGTSTTLLLSQSFGQNWATILERPERNGSSPLDRVMTGLWKIREPVTFDAFCRWFSLQPSNALKYPVLSAILQHEKTLPCIKYIGDILAWHSFLFSVLPSTTTREQAGTWSNIEIVRDIAPPDRLEEGLRVLRAFCAAFNQCFNLVGFLYECNPNPFLTEDGRVDLSGGKRGGDDVCMGDGTTVNFSLPTAFHGETEAAGLCTIRLLTTLQDAHNRIAISLKDISEEEVFDDMQADGEEKKEAMQRNHLASATSYLRPGVVPAMRGQQQEPTGQSAVEEHVEEDVKEDIPLRDIGTIPVTSHRTPASIISQRLLVYDRLTTLMPAVTSSALQYPEPGLGNIQGFDMGRIEFELRETLLAQCSPLALHVLQFQFAGEIRKSGGLRGLAAKTRQEPLPSTIINQIWDEVDTQARLIRLLAVLEECITFVVLAGGATVQTVDDGDILLENYVLDTLLMNPRKWEEIRCPTLAQHVKLCNLQSIYLNLEERGGEDPLSTVALAYRELLPGHLETALKQNSGIIDIFVFLPILREFCSEQLAQDTWPPEANLKEYMEYSSEVDLDLLDWFAAVPDELELRHAYWTYRILAK